MALLPNPVAWVDRILTAKWDKLSRALRPSLLPVQTSGKRARHFEQLGCGYYGCVYPTSEPGIVFKVTSDPTEAAFVAWVLRTRTKSDGLIPYHEVLAIEGESRRDRPVFVIIRDEATWVGKIDRSSNLGLDPWRNASRLAGRLHTLIRYADDMRKIYTRFRKSDAFHQDPHALTKALDGLMGWAGNFDHPIPFMTLSRYRGAQRVALAHMSYQLLAEEMYSTQHQYLIGDALMTYLRADIVLADVHMGNVGMPLWELAEVIGKGEPIIVDPGHAFALDGKLENERIQVV